MQALRQKAYQNYNWRRLRNDYIRLHPLCAECLRNGKVKPATDVHHLRSPFKGGEINWTLLMDVNNLESLCAECHGLEHAKQNGYEPPEEVLARLDELLKDDDK